MGIALTAVAAVGLALAVLFAVVGLRGEPAGAPFCRKLRWLTLPLVALICGIVVLAYLGRLPGGLLRWPWSDKVFHFVLFGALTLGIDLWLGLRNLRWSRVRIPLALLIAFGAAGIEEALQIFSPYRSADWLDLLADLAGMLCFVFVGRWVLARSMRRES
jgi:hypothetical protein